MEDGENLLQFSDIFTSTKGQEVSLYTPPVPSILQGSRESICCYSQARGQGSEGLFLNQGSNIREQSGSWLAAVDRRLPVAMRCGVLSKERF